MHLSLLRSYLEAEFAELKDLPHYDLEKVIDDWIVLNFMVGNDFLPNLPMMHIHQGSLEKFTVAYKTMMKATNGYINELGHLNKRRFASLLEQVALMERELMEEGLSDENWFLLKENQNVIEKFYSAEEDDLRDGESGKI